MGNEWRVCRCIKERLKRVEKESVRLPRGCGFVRERETIALEERKGERKETVKNERDWGAQIVFILYRGLKIACCQTRGRGGGEDAIEEKRKINTST
jgi:hypothetical protein